MADQPIFVAVFQIGRARYFIVFRNAGQMVRFDRPCVMVTGAVEYFREHLAVGDYLTESGRAKMTWAGAGAGQLGLEGACKLADFTALCWGRDPKSGEKLGMRDRSARRRVCYFGQISPPKDVSLLHLVGGDERIGAWWEEAVNETVREMEAVAAARVRCGRANTDRTTGSLVAALVTHDTSRALDPQLHTHLCLLNVTYDGVETRWKSLQPSAFYRHQGYFREVCYNALARRLLAGGYRIEPRRTLGFEVAGVPAILRERFSKRRCTINREADRLGAVTQDALQAIASATRTTKVKATATMLRAGWEREAGEELVALKNVVQKAISGSAPAPTLTAMEALLAAEAHVFERRSVVDERVLLREALAAGRGVVEIAGLRHALARRERAGDVLKVGEEVASQEGLEMEQEFIAFARARRAGFPALGQPSALKQLGPDQRTAVRGLLAARSGVLVLQGDAGTGKTTSLQAIVAGIERAGRRVFGCAPSAGAAEVLRREVTAEADTLQRLLASHTLQTQVRGRVILVDEAGLVSARELRDLCWFAGRHDWRLLLIGDVKQHHAVEAGDALRCLTSHASVPVFRLTAIRRQCDPAYRAAVACLAAGDASGAFRRFEALGAVHEIPHPAALWTAAAADYVRTVQAGASCLAISPVWSDINAFTSKVRDQLKAASLLTPEERTWPTVQPLKWTREERRRLHHYRLGDILTFHRATGRFSKHETLTVTAIKDLALVVSDSTGLTHRLDPRRTTGYNVGLAQATSVAIGEKLLLRSGLRAIGLRNGEIVTVTGFASDGSIRLADGRAIPPWFREFTHGYAVTSHAAQGKTVDRGILLMADEGIAAGNLKQAYVSNSRFRKSQAIYTTDRQAASQAMQRPSDRKSVIELVGKEEAQHPRRWRARWSAHLGLTGKTVA